MNDTFLRIAFGNVANGRGVDRDVLGYRRARNRPESFPLLHRPTRPSCVGIDAADGRFRADCSWPEGGRVGPRPRVLESRGVCTLRRGGGRTRLTRQPAGHGDTANICARGSRGERTDGVRTSHARTSRAADTIVHFESGRAVRWRCGDDGGFALALVLMLGGGQWTWIIDGWNATWRGLSPLWSPRPPSCARQATLPAPVIIVCDFSLRTEISKLFD